MKFPANVPHDVRNLGAERCVIMFLKVNPKVLKAPLMGNVERCDKTLPTNEMMYHVRKDAALRARWLTDLEGLAREFGSQPRGVRGHPRQGSQAADGPGRASVLRAADPAPVLRRRPEQQRQRALECYRRAFPEETAQAMALQARLEGRRG